MYEYADDILYADDLCFISTSAKGLPTLVDICGSFGTQNDLCDIVKKSVCTFVESKAFKLSKIPKIWVNNVPHIFVKTLTYLGYVLDSTLKDYCDIHQ